MKILRSFLRFCFIVCWFLCFCNFTPFDLL